MELSYRFGFDAAHYFAQFPAGHRNHGVHGHSFQVEVAVRGEADPRTGFIIDFAQLEEACGELRGALDHRVLNEVEGLDKPSLENLFYLNARTIAAAARALVRQDETDWMPAERADLKAVNFKGPF